MYVPDPRAQPLKTFLKTAQGGSSPTLTPENHLGKSWISQQQQKKNVSVKVALEMMFRLRINQV